MQKDESLTMTLHKTKLYLEKLHYEKGFGDITIKVQNGEVTYMYFGEGFKPSNA